MKNTQIKLVARPIGEPKRSDWDISMVDVPTPNDGDVLVKTIYISLDPAMRGWMNDAKSYIRPVRIGEVMRAGTVGIVVESKSDKFKTGDYVMGNLGVQQYGISEAKLLQKVNTTFAPLQTYLGTLGMPGMTAYFGLLEIGKPKAGETVLVSGAAGAVGNVVGQVAKIKGCRVVGIAGGKAKCDYLVNELGFDAAIDYKNENVKKAIKATCPDGVDVYFDNVGGDILDAALTRLSMKARIVICGAISQYNNTIPVKGPSNYLSLLVNRATMTGMVVFDYQDRYMEAAIQMGQWIAEGKLKTKEQIEQGIENFPEVLMQLFNGNKMGKLILQVNEL
ncbi:MAG: NADPH-dependent curcumin reductase CurA [Saprospiraceae bacterium]|jgi:NADPH-dependent curcumin reductase CurA